MNLSTRVNLGSSHKHCIAVKMYNPTKYVLVHISKYSCNFCLNNIKKACHSFFMFLSSVGWGREVGQCWEMDSGRVQTHNTTVWNRAAPHSFKLNHCVGAAGVKTQGALSKECSIVLYRSCTWIYFHSNAFLHLQASKKMCTNVLSALWWSRNKMNKLTNGPVAKECCQCNYEMSK